MAIHYASWQRENLLLSTQESTCSCAAITMEETPTAWSRPGIHAVFNRVWPRKTTRTFSNQDKLGLDKLDLQTKASLFYVRYDARLCLEHLGPEYVLLASMSLPTFLGQN
jgi:hypothetical protein